MDLYFLRHGPAGERSQWQGNDFDRPLTAEGQESIHKEAAALARLGIDLGLLLTSPLARAYQTARIVAEQLDCLDRLLEDERLSPGFGPDQLAEILRENSSERAVTLVGHEPDLSRAISRLIGGGEVICKKGSLACVEVPDPAVMHGCLVWLLPPEILTR